MVVVLLDDAFELARGRLPDHWGRLGEELRDPVFPMLPPDRHEMDVDWWDEVARPTWFGPFLQEQEAKGRFQAMV